MIDYITVWGLYWIGLGVEWIESQKECMVMSWTGGQRGGAEGDQISHISKVKSTQVSRRIKAQHEAVYVEAVTILGLVVASSCQEKNDRKVSKVRRGGNF